MADLSVLRFSELLDRIAAKTPSPGGGGVACASAALAAALAQMVVAYSLGRKSLAAHEDELKKANAALNASRAIFLRLADEDGEAYSVVNELMKLPESDPKRAAEYIPAVRAAIQIPMATIAACDDLLRLCERLAPISNSYLLSDLAVTAVLAEGAAKASRWNVAVNVSMLPDESERAKVMAQADRSLADSARRRENVEKACAKKG
jgi:formiminotetrahydrofolate cyclodeaminase